MPAEAASGLRALGAALLTPAPSREPLLGHVRARWVRGMPYVLAFGFVIVLLPVTTQVLTSDYELNGALSAALGVGQTAPLLLAVTRPLPAWWIIFTANTTGALALLGTDHDALRPWPWPAPVIVGYLVLCLALALRESRRTLLGVWIVTVVVSLALGFVSPGRSEGTNVLLIVLSGAMLLLGATLRERAEAQRRLAEQETINEAERAQRTLLEERARIARELHDVVAHHMSVITVQADSAPYRLGGLPEAAREEFGTIAATARESLAEMRRLLGVLRSEGAQGERAPQPGLERLEQLVEATVRAGVPAELSVDVPDTAPGSGESVAARPAQAVTLSAYRIVQEALANVVRHAPGAVTRVSVTADGADLTVLVVNAASPAPEGAPLETTGTGHGLVGMRERVRLVGGSLDIGPLPDGGFRVAARLPLDGRPEKTGGRPRTDADGNEDGDRDRSAGGSGSGDVDEPPGKRRERPPEERREAAPPPHEDGTRREHPHGDGKDTPTA
ncbi:sensor histidine kinase [Streptomyces axinellae]